MASGLGSRGLELHLAAKASAVELRVSGHRLRDFGARISGFGVRGLGFGVRFSEV
jgi:hypothetical protein